MGGGYRVTSTRMTRNRLVLGEKEGGDQRGVVQVDQHQ